MKKLILMIVPIVLIVGLIAYFTNIKENNNNKPVVMTTFYPLYEFTNKIAGSTVDVKLMVPGGVEPHDYEPSAKEIAKAKESDVLVFSGVDFEHWTTDFLTDYKGIQIKASDNIDLIDLEGSVDPHFWVDPNNAVIIVQNITVKLKSLYPNNSELYEKNSKEYISKLSALDAKNKELSSCQNKTFITSHDAFGYIAKRYSLEILSIAGISPEDEPSSQKIAELSEIAKQKGLKCVYYEELVSDKLAQTLAKEANLSTLVLNPIEGLTADDQKDGLDYIKIQEQNVKNLLQSCN